MQVLQGLFTTYYQWHFFACIYDKCSAYWVYLIHFEQHDQGWNGTAEMERPSEQQGFCHCNLTCLENQLPHTCQKWFGAPQKVPSPEHCHYFTCQLPEKAPLTRHSYSPGSRTQSAEKPYPQSVFKVIIIISSRSNNFVEHCSCLRMW